ncbi:hypothetical protein CIW49_18585 [Mycolicibacterium sp. P1-18]|nr:hypothetical protein CIW49_18585 [Mycolicibacterium sp. P1-18]
MTVRPVAEFANTPLPAGAELVAEHGPVRYVQSAPIPGGLHAEISVSVTAAQHPDGSIDSSGETFDAPLVFVMEQFDGESSERLVLSLFDAEMLAAALKRAIDTARTWAGDVDADEPSR